jgi:hypothetical protein
MIVRMAVFMDVLRVGTDMFVHDAHAVCVLGQARGGAGTIGEGERNHRRQNAEKIDQREQSPGRRSPRPGESAQHRSFGFLAAG